MFRSSASRTLLLGVVSLAFAACKGHGENAVVAATVVDTGEGGIYAGTLTSSTQGATYNVYGAVNEGGALQLVNATTNAQYGGQLQVSGTSITGSLRAYGATGAFTTTASFSGTLAARSQITGTVFMPSGETGTLTLAYNTLYATPQTLATAAGGYQAVSPRNQGTATLTLGADGTVAGTTEYGCRFTGTASVASTAYDLFNLNLTLGSDGCGANAGASAGGLAYYTPASGTTIAATLTLAATSSNLGTFGVFKKQ